MTMFDDYKDEDWVEDDDDEEDCLLVCPSCRSAVYEDTQQCPNCGDWIVPVYPQRRYKGIIVVGVVVLLIVALILLTVR